MLNLLLRKLLEINSGREFTFLYIFISIIHANLQHCVRVSLSRSVVDWQLGWNVISETAALATALHGSIVPSEDGQRAYVERIPYGVVLGIARKSPLPVSSSREA